MVTMQETTTQTVLTTMMEASPGESNLSLSSKGQMNVYTVEDVT